MNDLISRLAALNIAFSMRCLCDTNNIDDYAHMMLEALRVLPPAQQWIPFTTRPCTEQEKAEHPDWGFYLDCQLPDDGDEILITTRDGYVCQDEIFCEGDCWYLDSGYVLGEEAVAWMPKPEPYKEGEE